MNTIPYAISWKRWGTAVLLILGALAPALPARAAPWSRRNEFAHPAFREVWTASDQAIASGATARAHTWGPRPWFDYQEFYLQSPNGLRLVQYFDKARMELNDPSNSTPRGVTNGLLTVELVSGRLKLGDGIGPDQNFERQPADIPVAGDPAVGNADAPTYTSFKAVATVDNGYRDSQRAGQRVGTRLDKHGNLTADAALAQDAATEIVAYDTLTGHNQPRAFRDFIQNGPVDGLFAFGHPISDPYWLRARVGGVEKDVLAQLYERRVVTYTPSNPAGFQVEMGNVGQHYFQWRYPHLGHPWQPNADTFYDQQVAYAINIDPWQVYLLGWNGISGPQITAGPEETLPTSWRRSYLGGEAPRLLTASRRDGGTRRLYSLGQRDYFSDVWQHNPSSAPEWHYFDGAVSPDGTLIAMAVENTDTGFHSIGFQPFARLQTYAGYARSLDPSCHYRSPTWLADGTGLIFAADCRGRFALYRADLQYAGGDYDLYLVNIRPITNTPDADNSGPHVSQDGGRMVFASNRAGQSDIYVVNIDGSGERRLTDDPGDDGAATWSPDGTQIIFESNRDGDYDLYQMRVDDPQDMKQLIDYPGDQRWPVWFQ